MAEQTMSISASVFSSNIPAREYLPILTTSMTEKGKFIWEFCSTMAITFDLSCSDMSLTSMESSALWRGSMDSLEKSRSFTAPFWGLYSALMPTLQRSVSFELSRVRNSASAATFHFMDSFFSAPTSYHMPKSSLWAFAAGAAMSAAKAMIIRFLSIAISLL